MANRKRRRSPTEIERDRRRIADLYLKGKLQAEIAEEVGLAQSTVSRDLSRLQQLWVKSSLIDFDQAKANEVAKIDHLEREYWQAWVRSCEDVETEMIRGVKAGKTERKEATKTTRGQSGDPRFLTGVQWCIERRCKILGFDAPVKQEAILPDEIIVKVHYGRNKGHARPDATTSETSPIHRLASEAQDRAGGQAERQDDRGIDPSS